MIKKYKLKNTNLYHNGKFVAVGSIIELNEDDAKKLSDVLVEVKEKTNTQTNTQTNTSKTATNTNKSKTATAENTKKEDAQTEGGNA